MSAVATLKLRLNKSIIGGLEPPDPPADRMYVYDAATPGLAVCVTATGKKNFYLYRRIEGKPERVKLGTFPGMSLEQARKALAKFNGRLASGQNPTDDRRTVRATMTLGDLWAFYLATHAKPRKKS